MTDSNKTSIAQQLRDADHGSGWTPPDLLNRAANLIDRSVHAVMEAKAQLAETEGVAKALLATSASDWRPMHYVRAGLMGELVGKEVYGACVAVQADGTLVIKPFGWRHERNDGESEA